MDGWLKALIAAACVVVILAGGYFAFSKYTDWSNQREMEQAKIYLFNRAKAGSEETQKVNDFCRAVLQHIADGGTDNPFINKDGTLCRVFRYGT